jgi:hypothetical protein
MIRFTGLKGMAKMPYNLVGIGWRPLPMDKIAEILADQIRIVAEG